MTHPEEGHVIAGKYRLDRLLSQGGMGSVWIARHLELGMPVAVKRMDPFFAALPEWRQRFAREARAAAAIQSPHVVKVHDYGVDGDSPYLVMELLSGEDLGARLRREVRLSLEATARLVLSLAKGLKRAHEAGVVHRDLKPANVFLARHDEDEIVQILDFGIAKLARRDGEIERTETGVVMGSVHYMSPEQARGFRDADHRADVWSLGVIAYRALTGELPFPGEETGDVIVKVCTEPAPTASARMRALDGEVGRKLDRFFARALAKNPAERFQTARELADALCAIAGVELEGATPGAAEPAEQPPAADAPTRTQAIAALAGAPPPAAAELDTADVTSTMADVPGTMADVPGTMAPGAGRARGRRRLAWALVAAATTGVIVVLAAFLSDRGERAPAAAAATAPPTDTAAPAVRSTATPAPSTLSPSPAAPSLTTSTAPSTTASATPSLIASAAASPTPSTAPSTTAAVASPLTPSSASSTTASSASSTAASSASSTTAPNASSLTAPPTPPAPASTAAPARPRPPPRSGDRVKAKFGF